MSELALFLVRTGFLIVMWIFVFTLISVIRADLFGQRVVGKVAQANAPVVVSAPMVREAPAPMPTVDLDAEPTHLVITEGPKIGSTIRLDGREIDAAGRGHGRLHRLSGWCRAGKASL